MKKFDISIQEARSIIPTNQYTVIQYLGQNWFKDADTGTAYHLERIPEGLKVIETRQSKTPPPKKPSHTYGPSHVIIYCQECGEPREIKAQDKFQVKRCKKCQRNYKNKKRSDRAKFLRAEKRRANEQARDSKVDSPSTTG